MTHMAHSSNVQGFMHIANGSICMKDSNIEKSGDYGEKWVVLRKKW